MTQAYDPDSVRVTIAGRQFDSHAAMKARFKKLLGPARKSTAQDIAAWRAARRKRRRDAQETRDLETARALLDLAGQLDPLVRMR